MDPRASLDGRKISSLPGLDPGPSILLQILHVLMGGLVFKVVPLSISTLSLEQRVNIMSALRYDGHVDSYRD